MSSIDMERPSHVIEHLRTGRGLSQAEACKLAGVSRATWRTLESGASSHPRAATKVRVARALGVPPSRIWRQRPEPLHLDDVEDPRWETAVRGVAQRLTREGSREERRRFGEQLAAVLDRVDPGAEEEGQREEQRWQELWQLAGSLALEEHPLPIAIVDGRLVESQRYGPITSTRPEAIAIRRRRANARGADRSRSERR
ncbi:MAG TPA: helix-turn-helix transcriptional regulator [Solirubrobacteraceae bacterium]|nr:helix-turn-helix transcriptional regulator [Solirubrobacteraceae bacterium]